MGEHILKRHNKTLLLYHLVLPLKYRRSVITDEIGEGLKQICIGISERYEVHAGIGHGFPEIELKLWGGKSWTSGFYAKYSWSICK